MVNEENCVIEILKYAQAHANSACAAELADECPARLAGLCTIKFSTLCDKRIAELAKSKFSGICPPGCQSEDNVRRLLRGLMNWGKVAHHQIKNIRKGYHIHVWSLKTR